MRTVGSARANLFASCAAGVCALWGPLHGGANVEVMEMLERIHDGGLSPEECIREAKDKAIHFRLYGFGHRVYKNYDPRAKILAACLRPRLCRRIKRQDPLLDIARKLEELALDDPYFAERRLYPNVDFYSGILLRAIGIPTNMFTVCSAIGRLPGWIAQWKEQHDDPSTKIVRPRQIYTGPTQRTTCRWTSGRLRVVRRPSAELTIRLCDSSSLFCLWLPVTEATGRASKVSVTPPYNSARQLCEAAYFPNTAAIRLLNSPRVSTSSQPASRARRSKSSCTCGPKATMAPGGGASCRTAATTFSTSSPG